MRPLVACILSRDEPLILRENVAHFIYNEGVEYVIVTNHVSIDENREALSVFGDKIYKQYDYPDPLPFDQNPWRTQMLRTAVRELDAAWMICSDTDEFWYGLQKLRDVPENFNSVHVRDYVEHFGTLEDPTKGYSVYNMPWGWRRTPGLGKTIHRGVSEDIEIFHCSHKPGQPGDVMYEDHGITQHHYPVRDWERFLLKVNTSNINNMPYAARTKWRKLQKQGTLFRHWQKKYSPSAARLKDPKRRKRVVYFVPPLTPVQAGGIYDTGHSQKD